MGIKLQLFGWAIFGWLWLAHFWVDPFWLAEMVAHFWLACDTNQA
jgi:hypothetical protein